MVLNPGDVRKHTPIESEKQRRLFGAAYSYKKAGKAKPSYVPQSLWDVPLSILKAHLDESEGKKFPMKVKKES